VLTFSFSDFVATGGMAQRERDAAERAIAQERAFWLPILEAACAAVLPAETEDDLLTHVILAGEIRRLRKLLHLPPAPSPDAIERRRELTRERVRRYRERHATRLCVAPPR
jgi:hypothetical protein